MTRPSCRLPTLCLRLTTLASRSFATFAFATCASTLNRIAWIHFITIQCNHLRIGFVLSSLDVEPMRQTLRVRSKVPRRPRFSAGERSVDLNSAFVVFLCGPAACARTRWPNNTGEHSQVLSLLLAALITKRLSDDERPRRNVRST